MLPRFALTPRHAEFTPCRVLSYGVYRFLCLMKYFFALTTFNMDTFGIVDTRHVFAYGISFRRQRFVERFSYFFFSFNWSRGKLRTFSFRGKYGAKYKDIYLIPFKYTHKKTLNYKIFSRENIVSHVKFYFIRISNYKIMKFLQIYIVN